jgi:glycosyltransferase involved in cell wall biosynthesis
VLKAALSISVIVCTHNRAAYLAKALQSLVSQTLDKDEFEVIVVDNASTDRTPHVFEETIFGGPARYIYEARLGLSWARNAGLRAVRGRYVAYQDDDAVACPDWLERAQETLEAFGPRLGLLGGRTTPYGRRRDPTGCRMSS